MAEPEAAGPADPADHADAADGPAADLYAAVVGQQRALRNLRAAARSPVHAYLFVGPAGVGMREAARAFAADVLCPSGGCGDCVSCRNALHERHPDLVVIERQGASISKEQIDKIIQLAVRPPSSASRFKVIVLVDFHLVDQQYAKVLKTIEEPPASTVFVILAEQVPPELVTIASRCVRVDFGPLSVEDVAAALGDLDPAVARELAEASGGRIDRARLLADDPGFVARRALWRSVPSRLDGSGAAIATLADELLASLDSVLEPLQARQAAEAADLAERIERYGERGSGRRELEDRHKREVRRVRADELRFGMATAAGAYRDALVGAGGDGDGRAPLAKAGAVRAIRALDAAAEALVRNPNETLLLQGLLAALTDAAEG